MLLWADAVVDSARSRVSSIVRDPHDGRAVLRRQLASNAHRGGASARTRRRVDPTPAQTRHLPRHEFEPSHSRSAAASRWFSPPSPPRDLLILALIAGSTVGLLAITWRTASAAGEASAWPTYDVSALDVLPADFTVGGREGRGGESAAATTSWTDYGGVRSSHRWQEQGRAPPDASSGVASAAGAQPVDAVGGVGLGGEAGDGGGDGGGGGGAVFYCDGGPSDDGVADWFATHGSSTEGSTQNTVDKNTGAATTPPPQPPPQPPDGDGGTSPSSLSTSHTSDGGNSVPAGRGSGSDDGGGGGTTRPPFAAPAFSASNFPPLPPAPPTTAPPLQAMADSDASAALKMLASFALDAVKPEIKGADGVFSFVHHPVRDGVLVCEKTTAFQPGVSAPTEGDEDLLHHAEVAGTLNRVP